MGIKGQKTKRIKEKTMKRKKWDKLGLSLSSLTEAVIGIILFLSVLAIIIVGMNVSYSKSYDATVGLGTDDTRNAFNDYQGTLESGLASDSSTSAINGVSVVGSWGMVYAGLRMTLDFVTGSFIQNAIGLLRLGEAGVYLGWALRLLFIFGIAFIAIKILFKVKP